MVLLFTVGTPETARCDRKRPGRLVISKHNGNELTKMNYVIRYKYKLSKCQPRSPESPPPESRRD